MLLEISIVQMDGHFCQAVGQSFAREINETLAIFSAQKKTAPKGGLCVVMLS